jgi:apolipoprotein N-acyltransferase
MASRRDALLALGASAVLFYFGTGMAPIAVLAWLAPLPVLLLARRVSAKVAIGVASIAYFLGSASGWNYFLHSIDVPLPMALLINIGGAALFGLIVGLFRALLNRGRALLAMVAAPAAWTGTLYLVSLVTPTGVMGTLVTTQGDVPLVLQIAAVTGAWGVEFLVLFLPCAVACISLRTGIVAATVFAIVLGYGVFRLSAEDGTSQRVALVVRNQSPWGADVSTPAGQDIVKSYVDQIAALPAGVKMVVLPEGGFAADDTSLPALVRPMEQVARARGTDIVVGLILTRNKSRFNTALGIQASGGDPIEYHKQNVGVSPDQPGHELVFMPGTSVAFQVCMDINFPNPSRDYAAAGATLMAIPASDEDVNGWQHARTALLRGVENGFAVAWSGQRGTLMLADSWGRVTAETRTGGSPSFATVIADVPMGSGATLYTRLGDWFAWLCLALILAGLVALRARPTRADVLLATERERSLKSGLRL